jgi:hypothetical protein
MPADHAQSKGLREIFPVEACILRNFVALPIIEPTAPHWGSMPTRRTFILAAALGAAVTLFALPLRASAEASALAFVSDIYNAYKGKEAKGRPLDDERAIRRAFEPSLAALMVRDQKFAAKRGEVGLLDFDPFVDAQDWEISDLDIAVDDSAPGKATATVKFINFNKPVSVRLDLIKIKNDWRIADITWTRDGKADNLRKIYGR